MYFAQFLLGYCKANRDLFHVFHIPLFFSSSIIEIGATVFFFLIIIKSSIFKFFFFLNQFCINLNIKNVWISHCSETIVIEFNYHGIRKFTQLEPDQRSEMEMHARFTLVKQKKIGSTMFWR